MGLESPIKTSVIIPVYNTEDYLPACIDSVLAQTQQEIEVILVDDGSTDGSLAIERAYAERDSRIRIIQQPNLRQGTARNHGLEEAHGEYVYFMDSDDFIVPELFDTCYSDCETQNLDFAVFDSAGFRDNPNVERPELFGEVLDRSKSIATGITNGAEFWTKYYSQGLLPLICWLQYFRRSFLLKNNLRFVERIYFEDNDWTVRAYMAAQRIRYLPLKLHRYRDRPGSNVHSGFSHVLADSCFDVHRILTELMRNHIDNPLHIGMIQDVSNCVDARFLQFNNLGETDHLRNLSIDFSKELIASCKDPTLPEQLFNMHFNTLVHLFEGTIAWKNMPVLLDRETLESIILPDMPSEEEAPRLGIYGTGKGCRLFLELFGTGKRTCYFFETDATPVKSFRGKRVHSILEAAEFDLDAIVITSAKYADEMKGRIAASLGTEIDVLVVPKAIFSLGPLNTIQHVRHPRMHIAYKTAKKTIKRMLQQTRLMG